MQMVYKARKEWGPVPSAATKTYLCACILIFLHQFYFARPDHWDGTTETNLQAIVSTTTHPFGKMSAAESLKFFAMIDAEFVVIQVLSCMAIIGNAVILAVIQRYATIGIPEVYMIALAVSDLCTGVFGSWKALTERHNTLSDAMFTFSAQTYWSAMGLDAASSISASLLAMALSVDRCLALKFPLKHAELWSVRKAKVFVGMVGLISLVVGINYPLRYSVSLVNRGPRGILLSYLTTLGKNEAMTIVSNYTEFLLRFAIPLLVMGVSNTWTMLAIWNSDRFRKKLDVSTKSALKAPRCLAITVGLVIVFFFTQLLNAVLLMDGMIFSYQHRGTLPMETADTVSNILKKTNSVVNFFVYLVMGREFRRTLFGKIRGGRESDNMIKRAALSTIDIEPPTAIY